MLRFASLGSGSRGNAALVETGRTRVLIDCGFPLAETERRLARLDRHPSQLSAVLVTHEHADHVAGVAPLARRYRLPVWLTGGTLAAWDPGDLPGVRVFSPHEPFALDDLLVQPFPVPHDAREPCQFVLGEGTVRLGVISDAGTVTPHIRRILKGCDALMAECNHDPGMLARGPYPPSLKARVGGRWGHLNNGQAADLAAAVAHPRLQHLVVGHISERNNTPALARDAVAAALGCDAGWVGVADQETGAGWREVC
ncbi:MAG TPA: MBL fold metallo-hydrolase [Gammaproteobacteria bacterium]|nr:MBL fold metallo-hydrolase [Gammaproteobacteria bacterium]